MAERELLPGMRRRFLFVLTLLASACGAARLASPPQDGGGVHDSGSLEAGPPDAGPAEAASPEDAGPPEAGCSDDAGEDASPLDAGPPVYCDPYCGLTTYSDGFDGVCPPGKVCVLIKPPIDPPIFACVPRCEASGFSPATQCPTCEVPAPDGGTCVLPTDNYASCTMGTSKCTCDVGGSVFCTSTIDGGILDGG
jgi:hypothetical protein